MRSRQSRTVSRPGLVAAAMVTILSLAACGPAATSIAPSASVAAPSSAPPLPSPSAEVDVAAAFLDIVTADDFRGRAEVSGTVSLASFDGEAEGDFQFNGPDTHTVLTLAIAGQEQTTESLTVDGQDYDKTADGPWIAGDTTTDEPETLADVLAAIEELEDTGTETRDGQELHHLELPEGYEIPAEALGIDTSELRDPEFTMEFFAEPDGTPAILAFEGAWRQDVNEQEVEAEMALEYAFRDLGEDIEIEAPDDVWERYTSEAFEYSMAHPEGWTVLSQNDGDEYQLDGVSYVYVAPQDAPAGMDLAGLQAALTETYATDFGGQPESTESARLGGQPAIRLVYHPTSEGEDFAFVDYATMRDGVAWEVFLVTAAGATEADDIALFEDFISTFKFE